MLLIVGLGNPENEYSKTRHNMGFNVINKLALEYNIQVNKSKFKGLLGSGVIDNEKVILLKPQTFMNLSGESVVEVMNFYKISLNDLIVIYDDVDIAPGLIRVKPNGSAGTHNGMKSIVNMLSSDRFKRVRVGIGKPKENIDMINHVIGHVSEEDMKQLEDGVVLAKNAVVEMIKNGIDKAMNLYN